MPKMKIIRTYRPDDPSIRSIGDANVPRMWSERARVDAAGRTYIEITEYEHKGHPMRYRIKPSPAEPSTSDTEGVIIHMTARPPNIYAYNGEARRGVGRPDGPLSRDEQAFSEALLSIEGVSGFDANHESRYAIRFTKGELFNWEDLTPKILAVIRDPEFEGRTWTRETIIQAAKAINAKHQEYSS